MRKVLNFVKGRRGGGSSTGGEETPLDSPNIDATEDAIAASFHEYGGYRLDLTGRDKSITKLHKAAWLGTLDKIRPWLKKATSADLDAVDRDTRTPLHLAAARGHAMLLVTLLDHKANPNICDAEGKTPFLKAIECGQRECVQLLLERNLGDRQLVDRLGNTALHIACANGHLDLASLLLKQGIANTESCNVNGEVALHVATLSGHRDCAELLLRHGASANVVDRDNRSPLMYAARAGDTTLVRTLLEYGAQRKVMDSNDWTAEDHAQQKGHVAVAAELKSASSSTEGLPSIAPFNKKDSIPILSKSNSLSGSDTTSWTGGGGGGKAGNETNSNHSKVVPISKLVPATSSEDEGKASPGCVIPPPCKPPRSWELIQSGVIDQGGAEPRRRSLLTLGTLRSKRESFTESLTDSAPSPHDDSPAGTLAPNHTSQHAQQATDSAQWIPSHSFSKHDSLGATNVVTIGEPTEPLSSKPPSIHQKGASDEAASDWDSDESLPLDSNSNQTTQQQPPISGLTTSIEGKPPLLRTPSIDLPDDSIFPGVIGQINEHSEEKETNLTPVGTLGRDGTLQGRDEIWAANATTCVNANNLAPPVRPDRLLFASPGIGAPFKSSRSLDAAVPSRSLDGLEDHPLPLGAPQPPPRRVRSHARNRSVSVQSWSTLPAALGPSSSAYYDAVTSVCAQSSMAGVGVPAPSFDRVLADNRHINAQLECYDQALRELAQVALAKPRPPSVTDKYLSLPRTHELIDEAFREMGPPAQRHASSLPRHVVPPIYRTSSGGAESDSDDEEEDSDSPLLSSGAAKKIYSRPDKQVPDDRRSSEDEGGSVTTMVVHVQIEPGPPATSSDSDMKDTIYSGTEEDNEPLTIKIKQEELNTDEIKTETPKNGFNTPISSIDRPLKFDAVKETIIEDIKECNSKSEEEDDDVKLIKDKIIDQKKEMIKFEETVEEEEEEDGPPSESPPPPPIIDVIDDTIQEDGEDLLATPRSGTSDVTVRTASLERPVSSLAQRRRRTALLAMRDLADRSGAGSEEEDEPPFWISARQATVVERIDFIPPELDPDRSLMDALRKPQVSSIVIHSVAEQVPVNELDNGEIGADDEIVGNGLGGGVHSSPEHPDLSSFSADIEGELKSPDLISDGESGLSHNELTPQHNYSFKTPRHAALQAQLREATRDRGRLEECCAELSERGDRLKYELAEAEEVAHSRSDVIALLHGQIAQLEELYTSSLEEIQACRLKLGNRNQELKHLNEICTNFEEEKIHVQEYLSQLELEKNSLEKMVFIKEEEKRLQAQAIDRGKERLENELSIIREEKRRLSGENAQLLLRTDELQRQLSDAAQTTKELMQEKQRLEADNARHLQSIEEDLKKWRELSKADGKASGSVSTGLNEHLNDMVAKLEEVKERDCSLWQHKLKDSLQEEVSSAVLVLQSEYSKLEGSLSRHNSKLQRELDASSARQTELEAQLRQAQADLLAASLDAAQARATASLAETLRQLNSDLKNQLEQQQRRLHDQEMELKQLRTPMCYPPPPPPLDSSEEEMDAPSPPPPPSPPSCHHPETKEQLKSLEMEVARLKAELAISNKIQQGPSIQQQMLEQANNDLRSRVDKLQVELRVAEEARVREAEERAVSQTNHLLEMSRLVDALRDDNNALRVQLEQQQAATPSKMIQGEKECNVTLNTWANPEVVAFRLNLEGESNGNVHPPNTTIPIRNSRDAATNTAFTLNIQNQELKNELQVERERTKKLQQSLKKARADLTAAKGSSTQSLPSVGLNNKNEKADVNMALLKQSSCSVIDCQRMINELEQKIKEEKTARYGLEAHINNMQHDIKDKAELERELTAVRAKIGTDFVSRHEIDAMRRGYELAVSRARMEAESVARDSLNARLAQFNAYLEVEENSIDLEKEQSQAETQNRALAADLARIQQGLSAASAAAAAASNLEDPKNRELIDKAMSLPTPHVIVQATPGKELSSPRSPLPSGGGQVALKPSSPLSGPNPFTQLLHLELEKTVLKNSQSGEMKSDLQPSTNNIIKKSDDDLERLKKKYFLQ